MNQPPAPSSSQHPAGYDQGHGVEPHQMVSGYNAPARKDVNGAWDFFVMADFIYWQPRQDNMSIATTNPDVANPISTNDSDLDVIYQKFRWKPGFRVGVGMHFGHDDWGGLVEYTRFHNSSGTSSVAPNFVNGGRLRIFWVSPEFSQNSDHPVTGFNSKWHLNMDLLDFVLFRTYYVGTDLTFRTFFGGRATWIDQKFNLTVDLDVAAPNDNPLGLASFNARWRSDSWALGPRFGLDLNWMLGWGFRLASKIAGDISYTRYKKITFNMDETQNAGGPGVNTRWKVGQLRPHGEAGLGLGWGSYFWNNGFHIDFIATYDFNIWWNQNMMKALSGNIYGLTGEPFGDLYTHGLDLKVKFDF